MFHTDSLNNPADLASCGCDVRTLLPSKWFHGAGNIDLFSRQTTEEFPVDPDDPEKEPLISTVRAEVKLCVVPRIVLTVITGGGRGRGDGPAGHG